MYNTTNITNAENVYEIFGAVNQLSSGLLASFILFILFLTILFVMRGRYDDIGLIFMGDSFVCIIVAIMMFWIGMVGWPVLIIPIILFFGSLIYYLFT
jgi:hypothetical protein